LEQVFEYNWSKYLYYLVKHVGMGFTGIQGLRWALTLIKLVTSGYILHFFTPLTDWFTADRQKISTETLEPTTTHQLHGRYIS
jgi:hypothetical protein